MNKGESNEKQGAISNWGYVIFGGMICATIANMMVTRHMRKTMNVKIPKMENFKDNVSPKENIASSGASGTSGQSSAAAGDSGRKYSRSQSKQTTPEENDYLPDGLIKVPQYIQVHFSNLNLPVSTYVDSSTIKSAYRKSVMKYHPDRIPSQINSNRVGNQDVLKKEYEAKFKEITASYRFLSKNFVNLKQKEDQNQDL